MIPFLNSLVTWANFPFASALLVVVFSFVFQIVGLLPWGGHEADADAGGEGGGHDLDHAAPEASAGGGHEAAAESAGVHGDASNHEGHGDHGEEGRGGGGFLGALGVGKVPLSVVWQTLFVMFGLTGVTATTLAATIVGHYGASLLIVTMPVALVGGMALTVGMVRTVARIVPAASGKAAARRELIGSSGIVISSSISSEFGEVRLKDPAGRTLHLVCYTHAGDPVIPEGSEVVVTDVDRERDRVYVTEFSKLLTGEKS